jgi:hypothetical protein
MLYFIKIDPWCLFMQELAKVFADGILKEENAVLHRYSN